jgi:superfamily II DNA or RNA helicase
VFGLTAAHVQCSTAAVADVDKVIADDPVESTHYRRSAAQCTVFDSRPAKVVTVRELLAAGRHIIVPIHLLPAFTEQAYERELEELCAAVRSKYQVQRETMLSDAAALKQCDTALSAELDAVWAAVTAQFIQSIADTYKRRKVQVFCSSVERAKLLTKAINDAATLWLNNESSSMSDRMLVANFGSGELSDSDRQQLAAYLRRWPEESLCYCCVTCLLFQESMNVPDLDCVIETSGCQSLVYTLQRVGRVMRWLAGKQFGL